MDHRLGRNSLKDSHYDWPVPDLLKDSHYDWQVPDLLKDSHHDWHLAHLLMGLADPQMCNGVL